MPKIKILGTREKLWWGSLSPQSHRQRLGRLLWAWLTLPLSPSGSFSAFTGLNSETASSLLFLNELINIKHITWKETMNI